MFQGHKFVKLLNNTWVLDLTEFEGYKVKTDKKGNIEEYKSAFTAVVEGDEVSFEKRMRVPLKVLKEATLQILKYHSEVED